MYVSWSTSTTPPTPVQLPETTPSNLLVVSLYRIAPLVAAVGVGRVDSKPFGITNTVFVSIVTLPVPFGLRTISPSVLIADVVLPAVLRLPKVDPKVTTVVPDTVKLPTTASVDACTCT